MSIMNADELIYPRLVPAVMATDEFGLGYAPSMLHGTATIYVRDLPDAFTYLNSDTVAKVGADVLEEAAFNNLREAELDEAVRLHHDVWAVTGDHAGVMALTLPQVIWRCTGQTEFTDGVLFAAPTNDALLFHVLRDAGIAPALEDLARRAATGFEEDERKRVTPSAYWWDGNDTVHLVTSMDQGSEIVVYMSDAFAQTYRRLVGS